MNTYLDNVFEKLLEAVETLTSGTGPLKQRLHASYRDIGVLDPVQLAAEDAELAKDEAQTLAQRVVGLYEDVCRELYAQEQTWGRVTDWFRLPPSARAWAVSARVCPTMLEIASVCSEKNTSRQDVAILLKHCYKRLPSEGVTSNP